MFGKRDSLFAVLKSRNYVNLEKLAARISEDTAKAQ